MGFIRFAFVVYLISFSAYGQIVFTESFTSPIDTTRSWQGTIAPELNFKTEKQDYFSFKNNANVSFLFEQKKAFTIINQLEFATYGNTVNVSNGFVHGEYRYLVRPAVEVYPFVESVWAPSRGLRIRVASGPQSRYRILNANTFWIITGVGIFYEYEKWNYDGVPDGVVYVDEGYKQHHLIKGQLFSSFKLHLTEKWKLIISGYMHTRLDSNIKNPRFAYSVDLKHNVTEHFGVWLSYQAIHHTKPIVPVKKDYIVLTGGVFVSW